MPRMETFGRIDILINNAGITHLPAPMEEVTEEDFDRVMAVNCKSVYLTARSIVPAMKERGSGAILNVASTAGVSPRPRLNWYNASKGWMITATKTMAVELAPAGIRVNAICPVAGETPLLKSFMGEDTPEMRAKFLSTIPIGRFSTPEDMGNAACYPVLRRGLHGHRRCHGGRRRPLHLTRPLVLWSDSAVWTETFEPAQSCSGLTLRTGAGSIEKNNSKQRRAAPACQTHLRSDHRFLQKRRRHWRHKIKSICSNMRQSVSGRK